MENLSTFDQYLLFGLGGLVITLVVLWLYNRREKRRKHVLKLCNILRDWGLTWLADALECYVVGDYSGIVYKIKEIVEALNTEKAMIDKLWGAVIKVTTYVAAQDPVRAEELKKILATTDKAKE